MNMLDVCCDPTLYTEYIAMVEPGNECQLTQLHVGTQWELLRRSVARKCCSIQVFPCVA